LFEININEAWNAYHSQALIEARPLYPSLDQLITNNYPPLSFYTLAFFSKVIGDTIIAGRLLSFISLLCIAAGIFLILRTLSVRIAYCWISALAYLATMARLFDNYVGVNDPQLLAQAVMTFGFWRFVHERASGSRWFPGSTLLMVCGVFFKHNMVAMPVASFLMLLRENFTSAIRVAAVGGVVAVAGILTCMVYFGPDFASNILAARPYTAFRCLKALEDLHKVALQFIVWLIYATTISDGARGRTINILCCTALMESIITRGAEEVHYNAGFDLVTALHLGLGAALDRASAFRVAKRWGAVPAVVIAGCVLRLMFGGASDSFHILYSAAFRERLALARVTTMEEAERVRRISGPVFCESTLVCYLGGKPFIVDPINARLRIRVGALSPDTLDRRIPTGELAYVAANPRAAIGQR
jgi:hypothetical protein